MEDLDTGIHDHSIEVQTNEADFDILAEFDDILTVAVSDDEDSIEIEGTYTCMYIVHVRSMFNFISR